MIIKEKFNIIINDEIYISEIIEDDKEVQIEYINSKNKTNNKKLKKQLEKFNYEHNLIIVSKFYNLIQKNFINEIKNILKIIIIFKKIKEYQLYQSNCVTKISKIYRGYLCRQKLKLDYLTAKILQLREKSALKLNSYCQKFLNRIKIKKLIQTKKTHYIIYSTLINNKILYFNENGTENKLYFEFSPLIKSFILFIDRKEKSNYKIIEGNFYNEKNKKLIDPFYETNKKGENIINFTKIFKNADSTKEKNDRIMNRYIKLHKPVKRERIDDYEERKKKAYDDHNLNRINSSLCSKKLGQKAGEMSRSKSFMKLKTKKSKGILKPSKSYMNLRSEEKKYILEMQESKNIIIQKNDLIMNFLYL